MRTKTRAPTAERPSLVSVLFGNSQRAILRQLFGRPDRRFYVREIARGAGIPPSSLQRDLRALHMAGVIERHENGHQVYYQANPNCPIFPELKGIVTKTLGVADAVRDLLRPHKKHIRAAFIFGSVAKGTEAPGSDIDIFIIGDLPPSRLAIDLGKIDAQLGRAASLASYSVDEFVALSARQDHFVNRVLQGPVIWLIGDKETVDALRPLKFRKPGARKAAQR